MTTEDTGHVLREMTGTLTWGEPLPDPLVVNQFAVLYTPANEVVLTLGQVVMPMVSGTPERQKAQVENLTRSGVTVKPVVQAYLSVKTANELAMVLSSKLKEAREALVEKK